MQVTLLNEKNIENSKYGYYHLCKKKVYTCMHVCAYTEYLIQNISQKNPKKLFKSG